MDIWLINHYAVPPKYYPLARQTCFAKYLMEMGHTVTIFAASTVHNSTMNLITDGRPWRDEVVEGVHYVYIKCKGYQGSGLKRIYNICEFAWKLPGVCKRFSRPDVIVATSMPPTSCAMGIHLARKYKCKGIAEIADLWPESIVAYGIAGPHNPAVIALRWLEKWIYTHADDVVFTMEGAYDYIVKQGWEKEIPQSKVHYINNGVELDVFRYNRVHYPAEDSDLKDPGQFNVVYTGSIRPANNLSLVLDAAKQIRDPSIKFLIWGDGDERTVLAQRVQNEGISNVVFKGKVDKKYIPSIVSQADLNLMHLPPHAIFNYGISPNKLFDYMAAEKPVLCDFPCAYNPAVQRGAGELIDYPTPETVARAIEKMSCLPSEVYKAYCEAARQTAQEYDFKNLTKKLIEIISE